MNRRARGFLRGGLLAGLCLLTSATFASSSVQAAPPPADEVGTWQFKKQDRKVKVMVLAGSIGAYPKNPYAKRIQNMCSNVEVKNLSATGEGAYQLKKRFKHQVIKNRHIRWREEDAEFWLVFQGGLNSVAMPESTNRHIRDIFMAAHDKGIKVVGFTVGPWGDESDKRWRGTSGLKYRAYTEKVVDFVMGRLGPREALGKHVSRRDNPDAPWAAEEMADIKVDLFHSDLQDKNAATRDVEAMKKLLEKDKAWNKRHKDDSESERAAALERDAKAAAELPQGYMREELRAFDHIHPNTDGHKVIAETACPEFPANWGCSCP